MDRIQEDGTAGAGHGQPLRLAVCYDTPAALLDAFERELIHGAVFVSTPDVHAPDTHARVVLELPFCEARIELGGQVVAPRPAPLSELAPGVSLRLDGAPAELRQRLVEASGVYLPEPDPTPPGKTIRAPRFEAIVPVEVEVDGRHFLGETANLSYNGVLALVPGADFANGTSLHLRLARSSDGAALELDGKVANQMPCDSGVRALGVQFLYELDRFEEVSRFVDTLRSLNHSRTLAIESGSLRDVPLETEL